MAITLNSLSKVSWSGKPLCKGSVQSTVPREVVRISNLWTTNSYRTSIELFGNASRLGPRTRSACRRRGLHRSRNLKPRFRIFVSETLLAKIKTYGFWCSTESGLCRSCCSSLDSSFARTSDLTRRRRAYLLAKCAYIPPIERPEKAETEVILNSLQPSLSNTFSAASRIRWAACRPRSCRGLVRPGLVIRTVVCPTGAQKRDRLAHRFGFRKHVVPMVSTRKRDEC